MRSQVLPAFCCSATPPWRQWRRNRDAGSWRLEAAVDRGLTTPLFSREAILATKLRAAAEVTVLIAGDLYDRGLRLWDTGQEPHYDVVYVESGDPDALISGLLAATHVVLDNEHYDPEGE